MYPWDAELEIVWFKRYENTKCRYMYIHSYKHTCISAYVLSVDIMLYRIKLT